MKTIENRNLRKDDMKPSQAPSRSQADRNCTCRHMTSQQQGRSGCTSREHHAGVCIKVPAVSPAVQVLGPGLLFKFKGATIALFKAHWMNLGPPLTFLLKASDQSICQKAPPDTCCFNNMGRHSFAAASSFFSGWDVRSEALLANGRHQHQS